MFPQIKFVAASLLVSFIIISILVGCGEVRSRSANSLELLNHHDAGAAFPQAASQPAPAAPQIKARFANIQAKQPESNVARRIIYDANIILVVKDMAETENQIGRLLKQVNGYVAEASVDRRQGAQLTGRWRVRVPAAQFDSFLDAISKLGVAETRNQTAQDVTEEYVDLEAQISNKKKLEERIVALLKDSNGRIKDVIEVERELARVRGEIEQMEGRLRYLTNRTEFTTVTISARVEENYVPPAAPSFTDRIAQSWHLSLDALRHFGEQLAIATVYATPWFAIVCVVAVPAFVYAKKRSLNGPNRTSAGSAQEPPQG